MFHASNAAQDWPLSREEKKSQLLRLYTDDVKAADTMLKSGNDKLEALREELEAVRSAAGLSIEGEAAETEITQIDAACDEDAIKKTESQVEQKRLRQAYESAVAVLRAMLLTHDNEDPYKGEADTAPAKCRARSEGADREPSAVALRPALCRTPRHPGKPKRRVSFGSQPEEEPAHDRGFGQEVDGDHTAVTLSSQWAGGGLGTAPAPPVPSGPGCFWHPYSQGPSYNQRSGWEASPQQQETIDIFVEAGPEIRPPNLQSGANGTFEMYVPSITVKLSTSCTPHPKQYHDLAGFKPYEEFTVALPEVQRVIFDPRANMPPNGRVWCRAHKRGAVIELPPHITMNAKLKTDSPFGSVILEDILADGDSRHKVGETVLNYRLQVDGQLTVGHGRGNMGANRLQLDLDFLFDCYIGGPPVAQPYRIQSSSSRSEGHGYGGQGYGQASLARSASEGRIS